MIQYYSYLLEFSWLGYLRLMLTEVSSESFDASFALDTVYVKVQKCLVVHRDRIPPSPPPTPPSSLLVVLLYSLTSHQIQACTSY